MKINGLLLRIIFKALSCGGLKTWIMLVVGFLSVAVSTSLLGLVKDVRSKMKKELQEFGPNFIIQSSSDQVSSGISGEVLGKIGTMLSDAEIVSSPGLFAVLKFRNLDTVVWGVDFNQERRLSHFWEIQGNWPQDSRGVMVGARAAQRLKIKIGESIRWDRDTEKFTVKAIFRTGGAEDDRFLIDRKVLKALMGTAFEATVVRSRIPKSLADLEKLSSQIETSFSHLTASPIRRVALSEEETLNQIEKLITWVNALIFAVAGLTLVATTNTIVSDRRKEFALSVALGSTHRAQGILFYVEVLMIMLWVSPLGFFAGWAGLRLLGKNIFHVETCFQWGIVAPIMSALMLTVLSGGILAVRRIYRMDPALILKGE